ncbi:MAG: anthranilate synthase component 1 [Candidatus Polarisedimenticolia bacterium]
MRAESPSRGEILPLTRRVSGAPHPLALLGAISEGGLRPDTMAFDWAEGGGGSRRRSLIVARSMLRLCCRDGVVRIDPLTPNGQALMPFLPVPPEGDPRSAHGLELDDRARLLAPGPLDPLRSAILRSRLAGRPDPLSYLALGVFAYDLVDLIEPLPPPRSDDMGFPQYVAWIPDRLFIVDHDRGVTTTVALVVGDGDSSALYNDAMRDVDRLARLAEDVAARGAPPDPGAAPASPVSVDVTDAQFAELVRRLQQHVVAGDVFQIVPSRTFSTPCQDPFAACLRLWEADPAPYRFYVRAPDFTLFGASPETALRVDPFSRRVTIRPIAGTFPRGRSGNAQDPELDARLQAALLTDTKELAEHLMLVDLARNDVARVSRSGTRGVARLLTVERYPHVMHLVSEVTGELDEGLDPLHAYAATLNMGTLVGAPKIRAAQLLREHETTRRGPYGGAVGFLTADGGFDTGIVIRSALVADGLARVRAGAGVVLDSDPETEALETRRKAAGVLGALTTEAALR